MDVRAIGGQKAGRDHEQTTLCRSLDVSRPKGKGDGFTEIADPQVDEPPAAPTDTRRFNAYVMPERRRIVAQVRRKVPRYRDFLAVLDSLERCDDLLTTTVDNDDRAGL